MSNRNAKGFTLVELLVVMTLVIITAGVSSDIILSLVRSYSKTKITNEVEQNANFALAKLVKELRTAVSINEAVSTDTLLVFDRYIDGDLTTVRYKVESDGGLGRTEGGNIDYVSVIDPTQPGGVKLSVGNNFSIIQTSPYVISINFSFSQADVSASTAFTADIMLEEVVVLRGTY